MLRVWGRRSAFNVQKVLWWLGELGLPHEHIDAGGAAGGLDTPAFRAMNPHGRIPVIDDDGVVVWESHTVLRYLATRFGDEALYPREPGARSRVERWMDWSQTALQVDFMQLFWGFYRTPEPQRNERRIAASRAACDGHFRLLDAELATRPWLGGDRFTVGDVPAGTTLYRYYELELERAPYPHVEAWYARLQERPAFREHVMRPFDELRGRLDF